MGTCTDRCDMTKAVESGVKLQTNKKQKQTNLRKYLGKACLRSRGHIFRPIFMKIDQNVFLISWTSPKMGQRVGH